MLRRLLLLILVPFLLIATAGAAHADDGLHYGDPAYPSAIPNGPGGWATMGGLVFQNFNDVEPETYVHARVVSCNGVESEATMRLDTSGNKSKTGYSWFYSWKGRTTPPSVDVYFTISSPGKLDNVDPIPHTYSDNPDPGRCAGDPSAPPAKSINSAHIKKWSKKAKGHTKAQVGKTARVSKTYLKPAGKGMKISYRWYVGSKVVDRDRSVKLKKSYVGRKLTMKATISKSGYKSRSKTLSFGKVRK